MFTKLENISDQLYPYMQEAASIIKKVEKEYALTTGQAIEIAKVSTQEMIADCLFHIDEKMNYLEEISNSICCSSTREEIENVSDSLKEIKDSINTLSEIIEGQD